METKHVPVLLHESIDSLDLKPGEIFIDGTLGAAGHTKEVIKRFGKAVRVIGLDQDPDAIARAKDKLEIEVICDSFLNIDKVSEDLDVRPDAILLDIGISSDQLDTSGRGFSFLRDEPLDMRMSQTGPTAADILNSWNESAIELILRGFGEEKYAWKIAKEIVSRREVKSFKTTFDLTEAILASVPGAYKHGRINPATRTFQALRIAVNSELDVLERGIEKGFEILKPHGRLSVITFHSLEDRIVKQYFRKLADEERGKLISKKPITASEEEIASNPRSRSAKLRTIEKND